MGRLRVGWLAALGVALLAGLCRGEPTVHVKLKDGGEVQGVLLGLKDGRLSLREGETERALDAGEVAEIRFVVQQPDVAPASPADEPELARLTAEFLKRSPEEMVGLARDLASKTDTALLGSLAGRFKRELFSPQRNVVERRRYYAAWTSLRVQVEPTEELGRLRHEIRAWGSLRAGEARRRTFAQAVLDAIEERLKAEGGRAKEKRAKKEREAAP